MQCVKLQCIHFPIFAITFRLNVSASESRVPGAYGTLGQGTPGEGILGRPTPDTDFIYALGPLPPVFRRLLEASSTEGTQASGAPGSIVHTQSLLKEVNSTYTPTTPTHGISMEINSGHASTTVQPTETFKSHISNYFLSMEADVGHRPVNGVDSHVTRTGSLTTHRSTEANDGSQISLEAERGHSSACRQPMDAGTCHAPKDEIHGHESDSHYAVCELYVGTNTGLATGTHHQHHQVSRTHTPVYNHDNSLRRYVTKKRMLQRQKSVDDAGPPMVPTTGAPVIATGAPMVATGAPMIATGAPMAVKEINKLQIYSQSGSDVEI